MKSNIQSKGYCAKEAKSPLEPFSFERRNLREHDVLIDILYCGICHSDIHQVNNDWGYSSYPMVPGHEIIGKVINAGPSVKKFKIGDNAGVGCMVGSCRDCESCKDNEEQYCKHGPTWTYNAVDKHTGGFTFGGYSNNIVVDEKFVLKINQKENLAGVAPLLCAGITTYSPLKHWKIKAGNKVGVVGLGGLGHMALKLAKSFGAHVVQFTTSEKKVKDAKILGADEVVLSKNHDEMKTNSGSFDFIIDTVSAEHDINLYLSLLKHNGTMVMVGLPEKPLNVAPRSLISGRHSLSGSLIGGIKETQEMLDYCAKNNIVSDIELIPIQKVNEAYKRVLNSDVKYRFVIDMSTL